MTARPKGPRDPKQRYHAPNLRRYGDLHQITQSTMVMSMEFDSGAGGGHRTAV